MGQIIVKGQKNPNTEHCSLWIASRILHPQQWKEVRVPLPELVDSNVSDMESYRHGATGGQCMGLQRDQFYSSIHFLVSLPAASIWGSLDHSSFINIPMLIPVLFCTSLLRLLSLYGKNAVCYGSRSCDVFPRSCALLWACHMVSWPVFWRAF